MKHNKIASILALICVAGMILYVGFSLWDIATYVSTPEEYADLAEAPQTSHALSFDELKPPPAPKDRIVNCTIEFITKCKRFDHEEIVCTMPIIWMLKEDTAESIEHMMNERCGALDEPK